MKHQSRQSILAFGNLAAGVLVQVVLGRVYAWSNTSRALVESFGYASTQTELVYGFTIGIFAFSTLFTGRLVHRLGPRTMTLISAALYALAHGLAALSGGSFPVVFLALGPLLGLGIAFGYVNPLAVAVRWFPRHKGLVTGLAVMGFGAGAILDSNVVPRLITSGLPVLQVLGMVGLGGALLVALSSLVLRFPAAAPEQDGAEAPKALPALRSAQADFWRHPMYWTLGIAMFFATAGGLMVIGKVGTIAKEYGFDAWGPVGVSVIALGNASGRLLWGWLMDRFSSRALLAALLVNFAGLVLLSLSGLSVVGFLFSLGLTGLQFGAALVVFAAFAERFYGPGAIARVYPSIFVWYGSAALLAPPVGGLIHDAFGSFMPAIALAALMPLLGFMVLWKGLRQIAHHEAADPTKAEAETLA